MFFATCEFPGWWRFPTIASPSLISASQQYLPKSSLLSHSCFRIHCWENSTADLWINRREIVRQADILWSHLSSQEWGLGNPYFWYMKLSACGAQFEKIYILSLQFLVPNRSQQWEGGLGRIFKTWQPSANNAHSVRTHLPPCSSLQKSQEL